MKKALQDSIEEKTISLSEFMRGFTPEQKREVENEVAYYEVLTHLRETRKKLGLTQNELAVKANLPRTTISKIESGKYNPTLNTLMTVAQAMNKKLVIQVL